LNCCSIALLIVWFRVWGCLVVWIMDISRLPASVNKLSVITSNYLWWDTNCIDRTNSAEMSEAVDLMFFLVSRLSNVPCLFQRCAAALSG
jgi:hypothetical protein